MESPTEKGQKVTYNPALSKFTRALYITPHNTWTLNISIYDITNAVQVDASEDFTKQCEEHIKTLDKQTPMYTLDRKKRFTDFKVYATKEGAEEKEFVADWDISRAEHKPMRLIFPHGSPYSSHSIQTLRPGVGSHSEQFAVESVPYKWKHEGISRKRLTLYKKVGNPTAVAKFRGKGEGLKEGLKMGGVILVNEDEIDSLIAALTVVIMMRRDRQRG